MTQKILVVDDSRTVRTVVEWVFHGSPYTIISAATASDGIRAMREQMPTVALIDYSLPDQSGFELCQEVRRDASLAHIPLIMLGGTWGGFDESRARACADDFIYKPFKTDALIEKVSGAKVRTDSPAAGPAAMPPSSQTVAGMPAVLGQQGGLPPLQPPLPPAQPPSEGSGFRRVSSGSEATVEPEPIGPPPLPNVAGPPPSETPLPQPVEELASPPPMPALEAPEPLPAAPEPLPAAPDPLPEAPEPPPLEPLPSVKPPEPAVEEVAAAEEAPELEEETALESVDAPVEEAQPAEDAAGTEDAPDAEVQPVEEIAAPPAVALDADQVRALVREMLPPIVKDVLAGLLRDTIGTRVEAYATKKIDTFVESELPVMAEKAIDAQLEVLSANVDE